LQIHCGPRHGPALHRANRVGELIGPVAGCHRRRRRRRRCRRRRRRRRLLLTWIQIDSLLAQ